MIAESVRHVLSDPGHSHLPLCPDYEGDSPKGEPLELRFPVKTGIVMDKPPALAVGCMTDNVALSILSALGTHVFQSSRCREINLSARIAMLEDKAGIEREKLPWVK